VTSPEITARIFDPRRPWTLDLRQLQCHGGPIHAYNEFPAPERLGGDVIAVEAGAPVALSVDLFEAGDGVAVGGSIQAPTKAQCVRCLEHFPGAAKVSFQEFFSFSPVEEDEEALVVVGGKVDLEQTVIDAVVLEFPLAPLCDPDCRGLCVECGVLLTTAPSDHGHEQLDPRWAGLREKFPSNTEVRDE
jgi:uncharacterized protein